MKCNYHTHSTYCDGKDPIIRFAEKAVENHIDQLGFSSHAPISPNYDFTIEEIQIPSYLKDIQQAQLMYPGVELFSGLECDFIPGITKPFSYYKKTYGLDFIIGGVHLVKPTDNEGIWFIDGPKRESYDNGLAQFFHGDIKKAVTRFWEQSFEMIETQSFDIIAHLDKIKMHNQGRFFKEDESWYLQLVDHAVKLISRHNLIIEVNSRGIYKGRCPDFYPSDYILDQVAELRIPCIISSDAHQADDLSLLYEESVDKLKIFGIHYLVKLEDGKWSEYPI